MTASNWLTRRVRWLAAGRNGLARPVDRLEAWLVVLAMILALVAIPVALTIGSDVRADAAATALAQRATRTPATAMLLAAAPNAPLTDAQAPVSSQAKAVWRLPDGSERTGEISTDAGTPAGAHVDIWLDRAGNPTTAPMTPQNATTLGIAAGVLVWTGVVVVLCLALGLVRLALDRWRAAAWAREWARTGADLNRS